MNSPLKLLSLTLACAVLASALQAGSPKGIPDLAAVVTPTRSDQVELWQPGGSSPHDHNMTLGQLSDWLELGPQLGGFFVPQTITVNGHALSGNITLTASDLSLGNVENTALSTWTGSSNLATLGTVAAGVWHGTAIADAYIASASAWNGKANAATTLSGYGITDPIVLTSGSYNDPAWLTHLAWSKLASTPTTLSGYGIADAVPNSRTVNGQALSGNVTITSVSGNAGTVTTNANLTGPVTSTGNATAVTAGAITNTMLAGSIVAAKLVGTDIAVAESQVTGLTSDLAAKAPSASPTFSGTPAAPTAAPGTNTTQLATTAFVLANAGGGSSLSYGTNYVSGYTVADVPATGASGSFSVDGGGNDGGFIYLTVDGTTFTIENDTLNDGTSGGNVGYTTEDAPSIAAALNTAFGASWAADVGGGVILVTSPTTGGGSSIAIGNSSAHITNGTIVSPGVNDVPAHGGNQGPVTVVSAVSGKSLAPMTLLAQVVGGTGLASGTVDLKWSGGTAFASLTMTGGTAVRTLADDDPAIDLFASHVGESLTATLAGTVPTGGQVRVMIVAIPH